MTVAASWGRRAAHAAVALGLALPGLAVVATTAGARAKEGVWVERRWGAFSPDTNVLDTRLGLDVRHRTAYVFESAAGVLRARAWDLDSLRPRTATVTRSGVQSIGSHTPVAVDEVHQAAVIAPPTDGTTVPGALVYAARGKTLVAAGAPATRFPPGYAVLGLTYDSPRDRVLVLAAPSGPLMAVQGAGAGVGGVLLDVWRAGDLARGTVTSPYPQPLRVPQACGQVMRSSFQAAMLPSRDGKRVFFGCMSNRGTATLRGPNPGDLAGIAELDLAAAAAGSASALWLRPAPGNFSDGDVVAIPGKRRLVLTANDASATNFRVFDADSGYYVGNVGLEDIGVPAVGFDPRTGRGYYAVKPGVGVFDAGGVPVTQGVVLEDLAPVVGLLTRPIDVDPVRRRVFVATSDQLSVGDKPFVAVLRDDLSVDAGEPVRDLAVDAPEVPGQTVSSRSGEASAIGAEFRLVGGPAALLSNAMNANNGGTAFRPGTRFEQFGVASGVRLTADEATAEAVTTRQDAATTNDMEVPQAGTSLGPLAAPVHCADFGLAAAVATADGVAVTCDVAKQAAGATAAAEPGRILLTHDRVKAPVAAPVQVRSAEVAVTTRRAPGAAGMTLSTITATAYGVDLMGVVRIGRVSATASAEAHGRSGTARTTYDRTVDGLVLNGTTLCARDCPLWQVRDVVRQAFGGRIRVEFPEPHRPADPLGRSASVTDNLLRHLERVSFDDVPEDSVVAPAMEVIAYLDGTSPSRLVVGLAAVSAQQRYRIFRVGSDEAPRPVPTPAVTGHAPPVPGPSAVPTVISDPAGPGGPALPTAVAAPPAAQGGLVQRLADGLKVVLRSPRQLASVAALWALLAVPVYLSARRRLLLDLPFLRRAQEES